MMPTPKILVGDALEELLQVPDQSIQMCVTSPPYFGLRDYGDPRQLGAEDTPGEYIKHLIVISREIRRVLKDDGTFWLNLGDSYYNYRPGVGQSLSQQTLASNLQDLPQKCARRGLKQEGFKEKDRMMIPARVAIALCDDGWYLRDEIVWNKPNPMPESVTDRTTKTHEFIYLLTKNPHYYYNAEAIQEPISESYAADMRPHGVLRQRFYPNSKYVKEGMLELDKSVFPNGERATTRNKRSVWTVNTSPYPEAHFATYPPDLIKPCILAGSRIGDTVLDPFAGRGTTGEVSIELGRNCILIELNPKYAAMCEQSIAVTPGML